MNNQKQAKPAFQVRRLQTSDGQNLFKLITQSSLAASAGLRMMASSEMQQWAITNWLAQDYLYGILVQKRLVGLITIFPYQEHGGEVGYFIEPPYQNHQIMTAALGQVLPLQPYQELVAEVAVENLPSQRVLQKNGFQQVERDKARIIYRWTR